MLICDKNNNDNNDINNNISRNVNQYQITVIVMDNFQSNRPIKRLKICKINIAFSIEKFNIIAKLQLWLIFL